MFKGENFLIGVMLMMFLLPPVITVGVASVIKLVALLMQKKLGWGWALAMGFGVYLLVLVASILVG